MPHLNELTYKGLIGKIQIGDVEAHVAGGRRDVGGSFLASSNALYS